MADSIFTFCSYLKALLALLQGVACRAPTNKRSHQKNASQSHVVARARGKPPPETHAVKNYKIFLL